MNDWEDIELHYSLMQISSLYSDLCSNAIPAEFYFAILPMNGPMFGCKCRVFIVPIAFFDSWNRFPDCPILVDDILPIYVPTFHYGEKEHEWLSALPEDDTRRMLNRMGYVENDILTKFVVAIGA